MTGSFRLFFGRWFGVVILAAIAGLIVWFILNFNSVYYKAQNKLFATDAQREIKRLENLYKNDKYGGKTPEETFDLFISALKKGDVELASKYFVLNKQDDWEKTLKEYNDQNILLDYIAELEETIKSWKRVNMQDENIAQFNSEVIIPEGSFVDVNGEKVKLPAGKFANFIRFEKYPSGIWKISLL